MTGLSFHDLLGVMDDAAAGALWPGDKVTMVEGYNTVDDATACAAALQAALSFTRLRVGSDPQVTLGDASSPGGGTAGQITAAADVTVVSETGPFYLRDLPNVGIVLLPTVADQPATMFVGQDGRGYEVLVEGLPVELQLPRGLITPAKTTDATDGSMTDFDAGAADSIAIVTARTDPTAIRCLVRLHLTPEGDVLLEPSVPISFGAAKIFDLPFSALHDLLVIPSPQRRDMFEWARNDLTPVLAGLGLPPGAIGFRGVHLDLGKPPFASLVKQFKDNTGNTGSEPLELVLEDVVVPVTGAGLPIPSHGTFGIRRRIVDRNSIDQAYGLGNAPIRIKLYSSGSSSGTTGTSGTGLYLVIEKLEFRTGSSASHSDSPAVAEFTAGLVWQGDSGTQTGGTVGISDDWLAQLAVVWGGTGQPPLHVATIAGAVVSIVKIEVGLRLSTLDDPANSWQLLIDVSVKDPEATNDTKSAFALTSLTGKPLEVVLREVGYSLGHLQLGTSISAPEGLQLVFAGVVRLIIEELGFVEEPGGGTYFSFSGGLAIGGAAQGDAQKPTGERDEHEGNNVGVRFKRLRFLTSNTPDAPPFKLDGVYLKIVYTPVKIIGFGYITDDVADGYRYQEWGFGISLEFPLLGVTLSLAAEFLKGTKTALVDPQDKFTYLLASLQIGYIPASTVGLYAVRLLFAYNLQPALDPPGSDGESLVLYHWHKDHDGAIDMPKSRNLADWTPVNHSLAVGVGLGFSLNSAGALFHIGTFVLVTHNESDSLILVVGELLLLKNPEPIAFVAIEYDVAKEKFAIMAGVDLGLDKFVGGNSVPAWVANLAKLSGTIYFGNKPWSLAIGQLADQRSWLGIKLHADFLNIDARLALGLQITEGGPKGFGFVFSFSGGADWGVGAFLVFGSIGFVAGTWKTGSDSAGIHAWANFGFKIKVFYVFGFGADIGVDLTWLGKQPWYVTLTGQIHIDTPWFLPDVTFQFSKTWKESLPFDTSSTTQALSSGLASSPSAPGDAATAALHLLPLSDGNTDPGKLYSFNQLSGVQGGAVAGVVLPADLTPVPVDADISLTFTNPLANDALIATDTYSGGGDLGTQKVQDLTVRYALTAISVKRRPRFGAGSGTWTDLVAEVDTELDISGGGSVHVAPAVSFRWDVDSRAEGHLLPNRLLINCRTPYSLAVGSPQDDEDGLANDDGFPCCGIDPVKGIPVTWHVLNWAHRGPGVRLPVAEGFSGDGATWAWSEQPVAIKGVGPASGMVVALCVPQRSLRIGSVDLARPALTFIAQANVLSTSVTCRVEAYCGLKLLDTQTISGGANPTGAVQLTGSLATPITRVALWISSLAGGGGDQKGGAAAAVFHAVQVLDLRYTEVAELLDTHRRYQRCKDGGTVPVVGGGGKLAFLPNHDYAVTATVQITVSHQTGGTKSLTLQEPAFFRTKGLIGLNAVPNVGDELRPYVAASYPPNRRVGVYRQEPVAVVFTEGMSNLLPVDRVTAAGDPPEKAQLMELGLSVEMVSSASGGARLTAMTADWLTANGGVPGLNPWPLLAGDLNGTVVRKERSADTRVRRFEAVLDVAGCAHDPLHSGQVLLHRPVALDGTPGVWPGQVALRATVRAVNGAYTERNGFGPGDLSAFDFVVTGPWGRSSGALVAPAGGRGYAVFGAQTWDHLQVTAALTPGPAAGPVGLAVGVAVAADGSVGQGMLALIEQDALVLVRRYGGADVELARATLPAATGPYRLRVQAFDDVVRASVGDVVVEAPRDAVREGRVAAVGEAGTAVGALLVESIEMFAVDVATSRYLSFADHVAGRDPVVHAQEADAMGAQPSGSPAGYAASHAGDLAAAMTVAADPQARQRLFDDLLTTVGLARLQVCDRLTITRLTDGGVTTALLLESPEPISVVHDLRVVLRHRIWRTVPDWHLLPGIEPAVSKALGSLQLHGDELLGPARAHQLLLTESLQIVLVAAQDPTVVDVYDVLPMSAPPSGSREGNVIAQRVSTLDASAAGRAAGTGGRGLSELITQPAGTLAAVRPDGSLAGITMAPWSGGSGSHQDVPVPITVLTDGDERCALVVPAAALTAGTYPLELDFTRTRWTGAPADDPDATYTDAAVVDLSW